MDKKASQPFTKTRQRLLKDPAIVVEYLKDIQADGHTELLHVAVRDVADSRRRT